MLQLEERREGAVVDCFRKDKPDEEQEEDEEEQDEGLDEDEEDGRGDRDTELEDDEAADVDESAEALSCSYMRRWCAWRCSRRCTMFPLAF